MELIVAISIGVIVSGAIAALLTFSINMYRDESANVSAQYELQTNINQIMDTIMGANCVVIQKAASADMNGKYTEYAAFGKFDKTTKKFDGVIFVASTPVSGRFNIYMDRGIWSKTGADTALAVVDDRYKTIKATFPVAGPNAYLLGEGSTQFRIEMKKKKSPTEAAYPYVNIESTGYVNPLSVEVELNVQKDATGKKVNKHVKDEAFIRNKLSTPIYIDGIEYDLDKSK